MKATLIGELHIQHDGDALDDVQQFWIACEDGAVLEISLCESGALLTAAPEVAQAFEAFMVQCLEVVG